MLNPNITACVTAHGLRRRSLTGPHASESLRKSDQTTSDLGAVGFTPQWASLNRRNLCAAVPFPVEELEYVHPPRSSFTGGLVIPSPLR